MSSPLPLLVGEAMLGRRRRTDGGDISCYEAKSTLSLSPATSLRAASLLFSKLRMQRSCSAISKRADGDLILSRLSPTFSPHLSAWRAPSLALISLYFPSLACSCVLFSACRSRSRHLAPSLHTSSDMPPPLAASAHLLFHRLCAMQQLCLPLLTPPIQIWLYLPLYVGCSLFYSSHLTRRALFLAARMDNGWRQGFYARRATLDGTLKRYPLSTISP